ncbi:MAG: hypothetical protein WC795_01080 [Candidatus Paceibacterota bacterium]|jgi:hypothetical protein
MAETDENHIEELKKRLYTKNNQLLRKRTEGTLHRKELSVPAEWSHKEEGPKQNFMAKLSPSIFKKFFIWSIVFFVAVLGFVAYKFYGGGNAVSNDNIDINILGNAFTAGGEELPLQIEVVNKNTVPLDFSSLVIEYSKGGGDQTKDIVRIRKDLGTILAGRTANENIKLTLYGEQGSIKDVKATLEYRVAGSNAIFVKERHYSITINSAPLSISINAPNTASSNQQFTLNIKATLNASKPAQNMLVRVEYPPGFQFASANPKPDFSNNAWSIGDLAQGAEKNISIIGSLYGEDGDERSFRAYAGEGDKTDQSSIAVIYNSLLHSVTIKKPFLEAKLIVNGQDQKDFVVSGTTPIRAEIVWTNNLPTRIDDVQITARVTGNALDSNSISPLGGFYDSKNGQIIWDKNTSKELATIEPGETGKLSFTFSPLPLLTGSQTIISDPSIMVAIDIKGSQLSESQNAAEINNSDTKIIRIATSLDLAARALYSSGAFTNTGPIPPKADTETTYTIVWTMANSANPVSDAEVRAALPVYVRFLGTVSPAGEDVSFDVSSRQVIWKAGSVPRGAGFSGVAREVSFQVGLTPSITQVGSVPILVSESTLSGTDTFTNTTVSSKRGQVTTRLTNDPAFVSGNEKVVR